MRVIVNAVNTKNRYLWLDDVLNQYARIAIVGGPKTGKTTLANRITDRPLISTDGWQQLEWSEASKTVADLANKIKGKVAIEGVAAIRAVRKGMKVDALLLLVDPLIEQTPRQRAMSKSQLTILKEVQKMYPDLPVLIAPEAPPAWNQEGKEDEEATEKTFH